LVIVLARRRPAYGRRVHHRPLPRRGGQPTSLEHTSAHEQCTAALVARANSHLHARRRSSSRSGSRSPLGHTRNGRSKPVAQHGPAVAGDSLPPPPSELADSFPAPARRPHFSTANAATRRRLIETARLISCCLPASPANLSSESSPPLPPQPPPRPQLADSSEVLDSILAAGPPALPPPLPPPPLQPADSSDS
jgi:hypothetical protein